MNIPDKAESIDPKHSYTRDELRRRGKWMRSAYLPGDLYADFYVIGSILMITRSPTGEFAAYIDGQSINLKP